MKKVFKLLIILLPWFISGLLFKYNASYYEMLNIPSFALPPTITSLVWVVLYILIAISVYKVSTESKILKESDYLYVLITNYLANQLFLYVFFNLKSPFFGFVMTTITFISSIFLYLETKRISKNACWFLIPSTIFNVYALNIEK